MPHVIAQARFEKVATDYGTFWRSKASAAALLTQLRSCQHGDFFKVGEAAGQGSEEGFEQAFSSLAFAYVKDKAPRLLDFMVGFQLVERNEDNTKAMGLFGFRVGDQWLYAPVFFLNGDLKGHELLYIKNQDSFVPMKENWVNYLMSRKPHVLGERSEKDTFRLGGLMPDLTRLNLTPLLSKRSEDMRGFDEWVRPALPLIAALRVKTARALYPEAKPATKLAFDKVVQHPFKAALAEVATQIDLNTLLPMDFGLLKCAYQLSQMNPQIKRGFDRFYGSDCFQRWAQEHKAAVQKLQLNLLPEKQAAAPAPAGLSLLPDDRPEHPIKRGALEVRVLEDVSVTNNLGDLSEAERDKLLKDTVLIRDKRDPHGPEASKAYNTQTEQKLTNPHETGLYDVLERPGTFARMLVLCNPLSNEGQKDFCVLVRVKDGNKAWLNAHRGMLWANKVESREDFDKWYKGLGDKGSLQKGGIYMAIGPNGSGTTPFEVRESYGNGAYKVDFKANCSYQHARPNFARVAEPEPGEYISTWGAKLSIDPEGRRGTKLRATQGELRVPEDFKFLKLKDPPPPPKPKPGLLMEACSPCSDSESGSEDKPIQPGKLEDIQSLFLEKTARLKIYDDHHEVILDSDWNGRQRMTKRAALIQLVLQHGLREDTAREMLKEAAAKHGRIYRVWYADGFGPKLEKTAEPNRSLLEGGPNSPAYRPYPEGMEMLGRRNAVRSVYPDEQYQMVPELNSANQDPSVHDIWRNYTAEDFQKTRGQAEQAAQQGQKEVFDTSMISGMLKSVRQDSLVDRYLGALMKALDRLGRILFMFYWHSEEFEDRYGKQDMPELEDTLRNSFETLGDTVLFLKEKTVEPSFEGAGQPDPDIEDAARI